MALITGIFLSSFCPISLYAGDAATVQNLAVKTGATKNNAPGWIKHGAYVYRICTPDDPNCLISTEAGLAIVFHLLDGSIQQIPLINGIISDDHPGFCNWDGIWPYWNHVSFRAKNWDYLHSFMRRVSDKYNTKVSFHVNLTDVNIGLNAYPETRAFFKKLVETKSIYRRDWNSVTNKRDVEPPYVPQDFPAASGGKENPIKIFALVNYKNFWDSGMAKQMIDEFYGHLPYPPPVLYVDVLTLNGGNFSTGFPDGPLAGSEKTQLEGVLAIAKYLRSKGTEVGTEGDRSFLNEYGTYGWLHCQPGISTHDYSKILGAAKGARVVTQHVDGNTGCFLVSPIASTPGQIAKVRGHYAELLAGLPITRKMPGLDTWHIADRGSANDEFNMFPGSGGGDPFRGDWIDLVNDFYLTGIQELYHIGKGNVRIAVRETIGYLHFRKLILTDPNGKETTILVQDCLPPSFPEWKVKGVRESGVVMLETPLVTCFNASHAGKYRLKFYGNPGGRETGDLNVYVNQQRQLNLTAIPFKNQPYPQEIDLGDLILNAGENIISVDSGPIYAKWSDGTEAVWETPSIGKGFKVTNGDVTFADDYDRMWPDTWSGQKKIYFFSWNGTKRTWKLPQDWFKVKKAMLYPLTPDGRGKGVPLAIADCSVAARLLPQVPYVLVPAGN